ncbi:serine protease inhibitor [Moniliophthora roreri]|uniref:Serine protease inhibitor n=1 Tax=Moniliophthora roreri TaxID=221103 RepID=A0A0W0EVV5_MONRR|nr:serine protease inhibitor [Moniliophthora roreri]
MSLEPGYYYIKHSKDYIGPEGGLSSPDVRVFPEFVKHSPKWCLEKAGDDSYIFWTENPGGSYTSAAAIYAGVFVRVLIPKPQTWRIIPNERGGKDSYVIAGAYDPPRCWVAPEGSGIQILYQDLTVTGSEPPYYTPNETFQFSPAPAPPK